MKKILVHGYLKNLITFAEDCLVSFRLIVQKNISVYYVFSENLAGKVFAEWHFRVTFDVGLSDLLRDTNFKFAVINKGTTDY